MANYAPHQMVGPNGLPEQTGELRFGACIWLYKKLDGEVFILAQKRAKTVHNGGFYDASAGGHVDLGEDPVTAALREAREEIGLHLQPADLEFLCAYRAGDKIVNFYLADWTGRPDAFTLDPEEVESVEWVPLKALDTFCATKIKPGFRENKFHFDLLKESLGHR